MVTLLWREISTQCISDIFFLLSFAIHLLLQETVTTSSVEEADKKLTKFLNKMSVVYSKKYNLMNDVHQLLRVSKSVLDLGPL